MAFALSPIESLFLRASDMPADILEYAEHKKAQEFKRLRQQMKDEQFVPTPATQPAGKPPRFSCWATTAVSAFSRSRCPTG